MAFLGPGRFERQQCPQPVIEGVSLFAFHAGAADVADRHRVHRAAVLEDFIVKVRAGREACGADIADDVALVDELTRRGGDAAHGVRMEAVTSIRSQ